ncbi:MAG: lipoyl(octanoyl) transferase LipB [Candidatus Omnitrophota bacterium]
MRTTLNGFDILDEGVVEYSKGLEIQEKILYGRINGLLPDTLIMLEHFPVVTLGRRSDEKSIINRDYFNENNFPVMYTGRGGLVTCHMPGQLLLYPVINLADKKRDISLYIDFLEGTVTNSLKRIGVHAARIEGRRGVWVDEKKIAFTGIAVKKWVTYHGVAVNINNDITAFSCINPCGEPDIKVTSVRSLIGKKLDMNLVKQNFAEQFTENYHTEYGEL